MAKALQEDVRACPSLAGGGKNWPCMKRFLLGKPPCGEGCRACAESDEGAGHADVRKRARSALEKMLAAGAIADELATELKKHAAARA